MHSQNQSYIRSVSTTRTFGTAMLAGPPPPKAARPKAVHSAPALLPRDPRKPLALDVAYLGAGRDEWVIRTRGVRWKFSGDASVGDVLRWINSCPGYGR